MMNGYVVSVGGQKGGSGKSSVAQGLAVEAMRNGATAILADMDDAQQTSVRWAERRKQAGIEPTIDARLVHAVSGIAPLRRLCDMVVVDTPSRADITTLRVARTSDLMVIPTDTNIFELEPAVMFMRALQRADLGEGRAVIALTKVLDARHEAEARSYLAQAGYEALPVPLMAHRAAHDAGNEGLAVTEAKQAGVAEPARQFFAGIVDALDRSIQIMVKERETREAAERERGREGRGR